MKIGTRSVLFGAHQFLIHPLFVARAWTKLYGFPRDARLWIAFFVHDIGYWGKPNMDGPEGEQHPYAGAYFMYDWFGIDWFRFVLYHSRFLAHSHDEHYSALCVADKLALAITPRWLNEGLMRLSGEWAEYDRLHADPESKYSKEPRFGDGDWYDQMVTFVRSWVNVHKDLRPDTWTMSKEKEVKP